MCWLTVFKPSSPEMSAVRRTIKRNSRIFNDSSWYMDIWWHRARVAPWTGWKSLSSSTLYLLNAFCFYPGVPQWLYDCHLYGCEAATICSIGIVSPSKPQRHYRYLLARGVCMTMFKHHKEAELGWFTYLLFSQSLGSQIRSKTFCKCQPYTLSGLRIGYLFSQDSYIPPFKEQAHKPCKHSMKRRLRALQ